MARSSKVAVGSVLGAATLGGLAFVAPTARPVEAESQVATSSQRFLSSSAPAGAASSAAQGLSGALAVGGLSVAAIRGAAAASRRKGSRGPPRTWWHAGRWPS
ncbi:unnamed protein product [Effrenium voratum]|nr:unnamed protein product [Effrenium voratum]